MSLPLFGFIVGVMIAIFCVAIIWTMAGRRIAALRDGPSPMIFDQDADLDGLSDADWDYFMIITAMAGLFVAGCLMLIQVCEWTGWPA